MYISVCSLREEEIGDPCGSAVRAKDLKRGEADANQSKIKTVNSGKSRKVGNTEY